MWILYSNILYEGDTFHGIFSSMEAAEKAKNRLEEMKYDADDFYIVWCEINTLMFDFKGVV